jgi:2-dehydro-3-deoxyphosphooctonate aldolase (KDO 8-P synthase)
MLSESRTAAAGNPNILACERGTMFGYSDLVVDPRNIVLMRDAGCPVTCDITHALQQPAGRPLEVQGIPCVVCVVACLTSITSVL